MRILQDVCLLHAPLSHFISKYFDQAKKQQKNEVTVQILFNAECIYSKLTATTLAAPTPAKVFLFSLLAQDKAEWNFSLTIS